MVVPKTEAAKTLPFDTTLKHAFHTSKSAAGWALVQLYAKALVLHKDTLTGFNNNSYQNNNRVREALSRQSGVDESLLTSERTYWDGCTSLIDAKTTNVLDSEIKGFKNG